MGESKPLVTTYSKYIGDEEKQIPDADNNFSLSHKRDSDKPWLKKLIPFLTLLSIACVYFLSYTSFIFTPQVNSLSKIENVSELAVSLDPELEKRQISRLILIGDIHGHFQEFHKLLTKINYKFKKDHILLLGDFISKGPDSIKILDYLIENEDHIDCVLGNHEYSVLKSYATFRGLTQPQFTYHPSTQDINELEEEDDSHGKLFFGTKADLKLAKSLKPKHIKFINRCSVIKKLGNVPHGQGIAVHGGISPYLPLKKQNPIDNLKMRSLKGKNHDIPTSNKKAKGAKSWSKVYNSKHGEHPADYIVYYGHDASRGLSLKKYTKGLDSRCDKGGKLSAMVISHDGMDLAEEVVQVNC